MLEFNTAGKFTDLWALGCLIYEMHIGHTPFHGKTSDEVFNNILDRRINFPHELESNARDLIDKLLDFNPENRIGLKSYDEIKKHPYFKGVNWKHLGDKKIKVPCQDVLTSALGLKRANEITEE